MNFKILLLRTRILILFIKYAHLMSIFVLADYYLFISMQGFLYYVYKLIRQIYFIRRLVYSNIFLESYYSIQATAIDAMILITIVNDP